MLIIGQGALRRTDGARVLAAARALAEQFGMVNGDSGWNGFNVLHTAAARVGGLDLGFVPGDGGRGTLGIVEGAAAGDIEAVYLLAADEIDLGALASAFVIYQGHHGDAGAAAADVVLPGAAYTEKKRHLRQHRRPGAAGPDGRSRAGRGARRLGDNPGAFGLRRRRAFLRHDRRRPRQDGGNKRCFRKP